MNKICQNCKNNFTITSEDEQFYTKAQIPAPTFCPECRLKRRLAFMNERKLYKRDCDLCRKSIISMYHKDVPYIIYCQKCWWSDNWDAMEYGREYDFEKPFFEQLKELFIKIPQPAIQVIEQKMINSQYCNIASYLKNCYLIFNSDYSENCCFGGFIEHSKDSFDTLFIDYAELCYEGDNLRKCNNVYFSSDCSDSFDIYFSKNLTGCSDCFGCINLRNKKYYIFNKPYSKEEYFIKLKEFDLGSYKSVLEIKNKIRRFYLNFIYKYRHDRHNVNVDGDYIYNSKNIKASYQILGAEESKYCHFLILKETKDSYDYTMWGGGAIRMYECMGAGGGQNNVKFCSEVWAIGMNIEYSRLCFSSVSNIFGCISLKNKQYCILNKQYTKEEYEELVPKIKKHMG